LRGTVTDVRVVCANTLRWAESSVASLYVSHAKGVETRVKNAIDTLGWANDATRATFAIYEALAVKPLPTDKARQYFQDVFAEGEEVISARQGLTLDRLTELYRTGNGNQGRTVFDALNAVTDWIDHARPLRNEESNPERRFLFTAFGGDGDRIKADAFRKAKALALA
jgi:hypothetical protein